MSPEINRIKGAIARRLGIDTGDREVQARGEFEQREQRTPSKSELRKETRRVKQTHHDYGERVPPQRVPHDKR